MNAREYLERLDMRTRMSIGSQRGLPYMGMRGSVPMDTLTERLLDREWLAKMLKELSPVHRAILEDVRTQGGQASGSELVHALEEQGESGAGWRLRELIEMGLLFFSLPAPKKRRGDDALWSEWNASREGSVLYLPAEVQQMMAPLPERPQPPEEPPANLEEAAGDMEPVRCPLADAVRDLFALYQAVRARPLGFRQDGEIRKPDLVRLNKALAPAPPLYDGDRDGRSEFLFGLCRPLGLLRTTDDQTTMEAVDEGMGFFTLSAAEQARRLVKVWQSQESWDELHRVLFVFTYGRGEAPDAKKVAAARGVILEALKAPEAATGWVTVGSLLRVIMREHRDVLFSHQPPRFRVGVGDDPDAMPYVGVSAGGMLSSNQPPLDKRRDWEKVEGAFIRCVLRESLHWLGFIDLALGPDGRPVAFRLTPGGAAALGLVAEAPVPAGEAPRGLTVQPNFEMVLIPEVTGFAVAIELDRLADRVSTDRAIIYRLSRESVYRGLREGMARGDALATLERLSGNTIPQNVRHTLEEWGGRFGAIRLHRQALVLSTDDEAALAGVLRDAGIGDARPMGAAALLKAAPAKLKSLRARPDVRWSDYAAEIPKVLQAEEDGRLVVPAKHLTHYLRYRLEQFARPVGKDGFALDRERFQAAQRAGLRAAEIEQFLTAAATGPLPPSIRLALRGWSGAYRDLGMAAVSAITAPPEVLDLLLGVPGIREHVLSRPAPTLALVDPAQARTVRKAADHFGLFLRDQLELARPEAAGPLAGAEPVYVLPPRDLRSLLQRAITEHREVVLLVVEQEAHRYGHRGAYARAQVSTTRVAPLELIRSGSRYDLKARDESGELQTIDTAAIHAIRLLDPA